MPLWHNIAELMDYYIPPLPSVYWLDITRRCNLRCVHCYMTPYRNLPEMSAGEIERIID